MRTEWTPEQVSAVDPADFRGFSCGEQVYAAGDRVRVHGHVGHILAEYMPGMWNVRLERGDVCVPASEVASA